MFVGTQLDIWRDHFRLWNTKSRKHLEIIPDTFFSLCFQLETVLSLTPVIILYFWGRCFELSSNCESGFKNGDGVKVMNLKPLMSHLAVYGIIRSPEAARIAQQNYKDLSLKCTLSESLCAQVTEMWFEEIIWLQSAPDMLISLRHQRFLPVAIEMIIFHNWQIMPFSHFGSATEDCKKTARHLLL